MLSPNEVKIVLEAALLSTTLPLSIGDLRRLFAEEVGADTIRRLLDEMRGDWTGRGVELVNLSTGWRFQTRPAFSEYVDRLQPEKMPRYSRAVMETLAIIAYRQPVTRGDIEDIRGVTVSTDVIKKLEERGWIDVVGQRDVPGRPALYATTKTFLDDLGLRSLQELPSLDEIARNFELTSTETPAPEQADATALAGAQEPDAGDTAVGADGTAIPPGREESGSPDASEAPESAESHPEGPSGDGGPEDFAESAGPGASDLAEPAGEQPAPGAGEDLAERQATDGRYGADAAAESAGVVTADEVAADDGDGTAGSGASAGDAGESPAEAGADGGATEDGGADAVDGSEVGEPGAAGENEPGEGAEAESGFGGNNSEAGGDSPAESGPFEAGEEPQA